MIALSRFRASGRATSHPAALLTAVGALLVTCVPVFSFSKGAVAHEQQADAASPNPPQNDDAGAPRYGKVLQRTVNDNGHGEYLIDLDSGKLFERPDDRQFEDQREFLVWARAQGIDAMGQVKSSHKGLVGFEMIVIPSNAGSWDQRPGGVLENLEAGDPGTPATMDARGGLPATFFVQTREGARGVLQITAINEDNEQPGPDHIRLRFKPIAEAARRVNLPPEGGGKAETDESAAKPGKDEGSDFLRRLHQNAAPHLKELQEQHDYTLAEGEFLKRIPPPFPDARMAWYRAANPGQAESIPKGPDSMLFRLENGMPRNWGMSFGGYDVDDVLEAAAGVYPQFIDGPEKFRKLSVPGDWIVRADAPAEKIVADLEKILNRDFSARVQLRFVERPLEVFVARGRYKHAALEGQRAVDETQLTDRIARADVVHIFGEQFNPNSGAGGGLGKFEEFCSWLGEWIGAPVVSDLEQPPGGEISWRLHNPSPYTDEQRAKAHDAKLVLANVAKQTGLEFVRENRPVKMLIISDDLRQSTFIRIGDSSLALSSTSPGEVVKSEGVYRIDPRFLQSARLKDSSR